MTVSEFIDFLKSQQQDLLVAYEIYSEYALLEKENIRIIEEHCEPRDDGWVQRSRPDKPLRKYLMLRGN